MPFSSALTLLLAAAKLFGYAHYGWLIVFSPMILSVVLQSLIAVVGAAAARTAIRYR